MPLIGLKTVLLFAAAVLGQADIASLASKSTLEKADRDRIGAWAADRSGAYGRAQRDTDRQRIITDVLTIYRTNGASAAFKDALATQSGRAFQTHFASPDFSIAHAAILMVVQMPEPGTADALAEALAAPSSGVRYQALKGIIQLKDKLTDPQRVSGLIAAIGQAGPSETDHIVLAEFYRALNAGEGADADTVANAVAGILDARLTQLRVNAKHVEADAPGIALAARTYARIKDTRLRKHLLQTVAGFWAFLAERYTQLGPAGGGVGLLEPARVTEKALLDMMQATSGAPSPPKGSLVERIEAKAQPSEIRGLIAQWIGSADTPGVLNGAPFKLPVGLK